jgi:hypothetical protein
MHLEHHDPTSEYADWKSPERDYSPAEIRQGLGKPSVEEMAEEFERIAQMLGVSLIKPGPPDLDAKLPDGETVAQWMVLDDLHKLFPEQFRWIEAIEFQDKGGEVEFAIDDWHNLTHLSIPCLETPEQIRKNLKPILEFLKSRREILEACKRSFGNNLEPDLEKTFILGDPANLEISDKIRDCLLNLDTRQLSKPISSVSFKTDAGIYMIVQDNKNVVYPISIMAPEDLKEMRDKNNPRPASTEESERAQAA